MKELLMTGVAGLTLVGGVAGVPTMRQHLARDHKPVQMREVSLAEDIAPRSSRVMYRQCPPKWKAISGGYHLGAPGQFPGLRVIQDWPAGRRGWVVTIENPGDQTANVLVTVHCEL